MEPPPQNLEPDNSTRICQMYNNTYHFATMYDRRRRIPMFSAYKCKPGSGTRPNFWMIEPQLVNSTDDPNMQKENNYVNRHQLEESQAVSRDYHGKRYIRGHLAPVSHQPDQDSIDATFTLTNIVPQLRKLNSGQWEVYERNVSRVSQQCLETYVIVGAVPQSDQGKRRVNIPSSIWAAVCCVNNRSQKESFGVLVKNTQNSVREFNLKNLEKELDIQYGKTNISLFNGACY